MRGITATVALAFVVATASAGVLVKPREDGDQRPWVTVDASGTVQTITPTSDGGSAFTGSVATPTAEPDGSGSFLVCAPESGANKFRPFCAPANDAVVEPDKTYFITWEVGWFENPRTMAKLYATYSTSDGFGGQEAFFTKDFPVSKGYYKWTPNKGDLPEAHNTTVQFYFEYDETLKNETNIVKDRDPGTKVFVIRNDIKPGTPAKSKNGSPGGKSLSKTAIAVGVVVGLIALGFIVFGVWWFGKRKGWFAAAKGYGVRKSLGQRSKGADIKLREGRWSDQGVPTSPNGQNVFREELKRQERERR